MDDPHPQGQVRLRGRRAAPRAQLVSYFVVVKRRDPDATHCHLYRYGCSAGERLLVVDETKSANGWIVERRLEWMTMAWTTHSAPTPAHAQQPLLMPQAPLAKGAPIWILKVWTKVGRRSV